ncbi:aspartate aminotransferase family protein [Tepidibacter mesophilus]|uniref:aspartate aminotransferase family protein n=1 Tax=Tepidibacter mesophilus TaxID=655607 RepID=UPI000C072BC1|nr:aspartate aminotransferase family protein [Tepidibacter mesophilus]
MERDTNNCMQVVNEDSKIISASSRVPYYPLVIKKGYGSTIEDIDGNKYIDLLSSAGAINTGHSHPKVVQAIKNQIDNFIHYTTAYMYHKPIVELANKLIEITPGDFPKQVAFGLSGSDANDGMIKFVRAYTGRSKIISFIKAYHGSTYGSLSLSAISLNMRKKIGPLLPDIHHIPYPDCYRCPFGQKKENCSMECIKYLNTAFKHYIPAQEVAAVVMEPISGDAGLIVPPQEYVEKLYDLCKENGILFVSEEVQQGFGRTGKWFGIENFKVIPDVIVIGKAAASGLPLSAIVAKEEIMKSLEAPAHIFTMGGNPVCCSAAISTIDVIVEENLLEHAEKLGIHAKERFNEMKKRCNIIGDVRGIGLSLGVDLVKDRVTKEKAQEAAAKICYRCWEKGLILTFFGSSVLRIQPPLVITREEIDKAIDIIEEAIQEYLAGEISDEVLNVTKGW